MERAVRIRTSGTVVARAARLGMLCALAAALATCGGDGGTGPGTPSGPSIFGVDAANNLVLFRAGSPGTITRQVAITGLQAGESVVGIDFRSVDRRLYAVGSTSRLYTLDVQTGAATLVGAGPFDPDLNGAVFGVSFDLATDQLRILSDANQNLRLDPVTREAVRDGLIFYGPGDVNNGANPNIVGVAYAGPTIFVIDSRLDVAATLAAPTAGRLATVGPLGVDTINLVGFDVASDGTAYAALTVGGSSSLYTINLATGAATLVGGIASSIGSLAVAP